MRRYILSAIFLVASFYGYTQTQKISDDIIWSALYPGNSSFDTEHRLVRKISRDGAELEFRTELAKTFYYTTGQEQKALVVLFSYNFSSGEAEDCHVCHPEMEIATFQFSNNNWSKIKFVQNWKEATGSWGAGPGLSFKKLNTVNCLVMTSGMGNNGEFNEYTDYYNIETLKKVKSIKK